MSSFVETLRKLSSGGVSNKEKSGSGVESPRNNVWSSTFTPGRNANMKKMGSSYYDKPVDEKTTWDQHLESQKSQPDSPGAANNSIGLGTERMNAEDIKHMMTPENIDSALRKADPSGTGQVDYNKFMNALRSND